jgi:hypothetical protein
MNLRKLVKRAEEIENELSGALQNIGKELVFRGFQDDIPNVSLCGGCEIIIEYHGSEIDIKKAVEIMEKVGYISKNDFIL